MPRRDGVAFTGAAVTDADALIATMSGHGPPTSPEFAESLVRDVYGVQGRAERLTGERDENFRIRVAGDLGYVFKMANPSETLEVSALATTAMLHVEREDPQIPCPRVVRTRDGKPQARVVDALGAQRTVTLCTFLKGQSLLAARRSGSQRRRCGQLLARLARVLRTFDSPAMRRAIIWDLRRLPALAELVTGAQVPDEGFVRQFIERFTVEIAPRLDLARRQFVHNDFNARNILVDDIDNDIVTGVIDFGDAVHTALVADVAVGAVGQLSDPGGAVEAIKDFVTAYDAVEPLAALEREILPWLIAGRIVQNVTITSWHRSREPDHAHFEGFDWSFFEWRIELAKQLSSANTSSPAHTRMFL